MDEFINLELLEDQKKLRIELEVQDTKWINEIETFKSYTLKIASYIFNKLELYSFAKIIEFSCILSNNNKIQEINKHFRNKDMPTNVLSFPSEEIPAGKFKKLQIHDDFVFLGDIIFAYGVIETEASEKGVSFIDHYSHMVIHGILHCLGYDHETKKEALVMENLETEILDFFKIKSPYIEN